LEGAVLLITDILAPIQLCLASNVKSWVLAEILGLDVTGTVTATDHVELGANSHSILHV